MAEPTLYEYNGKKYNYDTLRLEAFRRLADEFSAEKDYDLYRQALTNLVNGIRDNRVSYKDGSFYDSQGIYKNGLYTDKKGLNLYSKKYKRDYYGRVANILQDLYNSASEYVSPEELSKIKWGDNALSEALNKELFGNGDPKYFKDLDYDEKTLKYGTAKRTSAFSTALNNLYSNFDKLFTGFDESQKLSALSLLSQARALFNDGKLSRNEWFLLSKIFKGLNPEELFSTTTETPEVKPLALDWNGFNLDENTLAILGKLPRETQLTIYDTLLKSALDNINQLLQLTTKQEAPKLLASHNLDAWNLFLKSNPDVADFTRDAGRISENFVLDSSKRLPEIKDLGKLIATNPMGAAKYLAQIIIASTYQYPSHELDKQKMALRVFNKYLIKQHDANGHTIYQVKGSKDSNGDYLYVVPTNGLWFLKRAKQYADIRQSLASQTPKAKHGGVLDFYMTLRFKSGGILKAQTGAKTPWEAITYTDDDLGKRFRHIVNNGVLSFGIRSNAATNNIVKSTNLYDPEEGSGELMKSREGTEAWTNWLNLLRNNSKLAETWANKYRELSPETSKEFWQPWYDNGTFNFQKFQNALNAAINNKNGMWLDSLNGIGHDFYKGRTYKIDGLEGFYSAPLEGYEIVGEGKADESGLFDVYTLRKKENPTAKPEDKPEGDKGDGSLVRPRGEAPPKLSFWKNLWGSLDGFGPEALELKRWFDSIRANNKISDTLSKAAKPVLKDTWQGYSPVTGDWAARQAYNNQAAETRRLGARFFTSDPSLMTALMFDANRLALELELKGLLADNLRWKETKDLAFKLNLDNMARLSDTANYNRLAIHDANLKLAEIEATREKSNWLSGDQYWQGVGSRWQAKLDELKALALQTATHFMSLDYEEAVRLLDKKYKQAHPSATSTDMIADDNYVSALNQIKRIRLKYIDDILKTNKYTPVYGTGVTGNYNNVLNGTSFKRAGGILNFKK